MNDDETVDKVLDDFAYLITLGNIGQNVATDVRNRIEAAVARSDAANKRDVKELCDTLRRLVEYTCGHCDARYCEEPCRYGEPKMPCRVVFDSLQVANRFDPPPKPTTADDGMPF